MAYKKITGNLKSSVDDLDLYYIAWIADKFSPDKCIVIHHGFGEHVGRYQNIVDLFEGSGYSLFLMDMRGHGLSKGIRGSAPNFKAYINDLHTFITLVRTQYKIDKIILLGHSLGGLIVLSYCLENNYARNVKALAANGSLLLFTFTPLIKLKQIFGNVIASFFPGLRASVGLNLKYISHDKDVVQAYVDDPLVHGMIKVRIADEILTKARWCIENASRLKIPVLLTHGAADGISNPEGTKTFFENCESTDKKLILYEGLYHEVYNETEKDKPLNDLKKWIVEHT